MGILNKARFMKKIATKLMQLQLKKQTPFITAVILVIPSLNKQMVSSLQTNSVLLISILISHLQRFQILSGFQDLNNNSSVGTPILTVTEFDQEKSTVKKLL